MGILKGMKVNQKRDGYKEVELDSTRCWRCGNLFNDTIDISRKTKHHSIPKRFHPKRNIKVPICKGCHEEINAYYITQVPKLKALNNFIKHMKVVIDKYEAKLKYYQDASNKEISKETQGH